MGDIKKEMHVAAIKNGTAIDHIPTNQVFKVVSLLGLEKLENPITIGNHFKSGKMGAKGIIKIEDKFFEQEELNKISLVAPNVVLNIIKDYKVVDKKRVILPQEIRGIVKCNNPKCITNNEPMATLFEVFSKENIELKCHYCNLKIEKDEIELK